MLASYFCLALVERAKIRYSYSISSQTQSLKKKKQRMARPQPTTIWGWLKPSSPLMQTIFAILGLVGAIGLVRLSQELYSRAASQPAQLQVDVSKVVGPLSRPWANLAQGGEDQNWRIKPISAQLKQLKPEYIRLDHVFDFYDIVGGSPGKLTFNFSKFDLLLDDIQAVGATPYISLSYIPGNLSRDGLVTGEPLRYEDWQEMVRQMVQHVSGERRVNNVYYEVWNEPDLFGKWSYGGQKSYLDLYGAAARGAASATTTTNYKIGGPATTALYRNWIQALVQYTMANNMRLDFVSWHRYSNDLEQYRKDATDVRTWVSNMPGANPNMEYHLTEWGHNSELDAGYDGAYSGAHTAAAAIDMIGVIQRAFVFEIQDGKSPDGAAYWGRWGMFTHGSVGAKPKARFRALLLLNQLGPQRVQLLGKGTFVKAVATTDGKQTAQIALANFDPKGLNAENVPVTLTGLAPGTYSLAISFLNRAPTQQEVIIPQGSLLKFQVPMAPQEVAIVKLTPAPTALQPTPQK